METARITYKGQVTIPKKVRLALGIQAGDALTFLVEGDQAVLKPYKKKSLLDFYGVLPATRKFPGLQTVRREAHRKLSEELVGKTKA